MTKTFQLVLIKPSHYDDDGYVIRWHRTMIPSNSLAAVFAIAEEAAARQVLGPGTAIGITCIDETNTRVDIQGLQRRFAAAGGLGLVALVGVQTNQFPRAMDIARPLRAAGIPVAVGGFHVSGVRAMIGPDALGLDECRTLGIAVFAGELEGRFDAVLQHAAAGALLPVYDHGHDLPSLPGTPVPFLPRAYVQRTINTNTSFDAGRGCPYQCSFCTIINVQGRKSRFRTPDDVEHVVRLNWAQGIAKFFITDDNFARNRDWERIFDRLIQLREEGIPLGLLIQVDTLCHKIPRFIDKARRAGVTRVFIGLENVNPDNLLAAKKRQNKIGEYRRMLLAWKDAGILTLAGYILGFPGDTPDSIRRDIQLIQRELPVDILEFFCLTPLPGSEDHQKLWRAAAPLDPDLNRYDLEHVCAPHPRMTRSEWEAIYREAWHLYYSRDHMRRLFQRGRATGLPLVSLLKLLLQFSSTLDVEGVHPLQGGILRLKHPAERRPGRRTWPAALFWPAFALETAVKQARILARLLRLALLLRSVRREPAVAHSADPALQRDPPPAHPHEAAA